jgi:hypothetical protein
MVQALSHLTLNLASICFVVLLSGIVQILDAIVLGVCIEELRSQQWTASKDRLVVAEIEPSTTCAHSCICLPISLTLQMRRCWTGIGVSRVESTQVSHWYIKLLRQCTNVQLLGRPMHLCSYKCPSVSPVCRFVAGKVVIDGKSKSKQLSVGVYEPPTRMLLTGMCTSLTM